MINMFKWKVNMKERYSSNGCILFIHCYGNYGMINRRWFQIPKWEKYKKERKKEIWREIVKGEIVRGIKETAMVENLKNNQRCFCLNKV